MTTYRYATDEELDEGRYRELPVVPVEPCEHGNTGRHIVDGDRCVFQEGIHDWCEGRQSSSWSKWTRRTNMSDLPTRELWRANRNKVSTGFAIADHYEAGLLMTRSEWEATIEPAETYAVTEDYPTYPKGYGMLALMVMLPEGTYALVRVFPKEAEDAALGEPA